MKRYTEGDGGLEATRCLFPQHEHDCSYGKGSGCIFLGRYGKKDLYACISPNGRIDTIIARYGKNGSYNSGLMFAFSKTRPELKAALTRAEYLGYRSRFDLDAYR